MPADTCTTDSLDKVAMDLLTLAFIPLSDGQLVEKKCYRCPTILADGWVHKDPMGMLAVVFLLWITG